MKKKIKGSNLNIQLKFQAFRDKMGEKCLKALKILDTLKVAKLKISLFFTNHKDDGAISIYT